MTYDVQACHVKQAISNYRAMFPFRTALSTTQCWATVQQEEKAEKL